MEVNDDNLYTVFMEAVKERIGDLNVTFVDNVVEVITRPFDLKRVSRFGKYAEVHIDDPDYMAEEIIPRMARAVIRVLKEHNPTVAHVLIQRWHPDIETGSVKYFFQLMIPKIDNKPIMS